MNEFINFVIAPINYSLRSIGKIGRCLNRQNKLNKLFLAVASYSIVKMTLMNRRIETLNNRISKMESNKVEGE